MEFILFLTIVGVGFYLSKVQPYLKQQRDAVQNPAPFAQPIASTSTQAVQRPTVPPLLGIEISASQQRRLGKDDPSVKAMQQTKSVLWASKNPSWLEQVQLHADRLNAQSLKIQQLNQQGSTPPPREPEDEFAKMLNQFLFGKK